MKNYFILSFNVLSLFYQCGIGFKFNGSFRNRQSLLIKKETVLQASTIIDADVIRKVAQLAQLEMTDEEIGILLPRLQDFMGFVETIKEVDLDTSSSIEVKGKSDVLMRPDVEIDFNNNEKIIANFPIEEDGYLYVPRVATADES